LTDIEFSTAPVDLFRGSYGSVRGFAMLLGRREMAPTNVILVFTQNS